MASPSRSPADVARSLGRRARSQARQQARDFSWRRETFVLPREEARVAAREWFSRFPKAAYMTEVESWRELSDGRIEFTMRRLPTAD
ncbi:MAG: hypothetical protein BGP06_03245 [Rhizobiales bacterium 65-9]|nr:hypothetical protein [Hyphomicrobiales bacterium]OJY35870.1 MAG: hypothetical protein BGP06_03245 [Rhizobiales bacterium 65-9]